MHLRFLRWILIGAAAIAGKMPVPASAQEPTGLQAAAALESVLVDAIAKAEKSVVAVARFRPGTAIDEEKISPDLVPDEFGSGVVIDAKGLIVTRYHVLGKIEEKIDKQNIYYVWVQRRPYKATVKAADPWLDLAVLAIDASDLVPLPLGDAKDLKKGQIVIALGNPYAIARDGQPSASYGIVANLLRPAPRPRDATDPAEGRETLHHYGNLIQTDCKLELGSSGGALVNLKGEMIGLTTSLAALSGYEKSGGYATPIDDAFRRAIESLKVGRMPEYGFLGVGPEILTAEERRQGRHGARVKHVKLGTPAAKVQLRGGVNGDVITHVNGEPVFDDIDLMRLLGSRGPGDVVTLILQRGATEVRPGRTVSTRVQLSKKRVAASRPGYAEVVDPPWRGMKVDYTTAAPAFVSQNLDLDPEGSVAVIDVVRDSAAWKAGMRPGEFISHVGATPVATPEEFYKAAGGEAGSVVVRLTGTTPDMVERTVAEE